jgi:hypothetical protein
MNLKLKAVGILLGIFAVTFVSLGLVRVLAEYIGPDGVLNLVTGSMLALLIYALYGLILNKLEYDARIEQLTKK